MSLGEAKDFITEKVEAVKAESQPPAAGDDAEDLVSCAINYRYEVDKSFLFFFIGGGKVSQFTNHHGMSLASKHSFVLP